jgi:hypothetical protein
MMMPSEMMMDDYYMIQAEHTDELETEEIYIGDEE